MQATHQGHAVGLADPKALISDPLRQRGGLIESSPAIIELPELEFNQRLVVAGRENCEVEFLDEGCVKIEGIIYRRLDESSPEHIFRRRGDFWQFKFARREVHLAHQVGFDHICALIRKQGQELSCIELMESSMARRRTAGTGGMGIISTDTAIAEGLQVGEAKTELSCLNEEAIAWLQVKMRDLEEESRAARDRGDVVEYNRLDQEAGVIEDHLNRNTRNGKPRRESSDRDKARNAVSIAITRGLKTLKKHQPALAKFLQTQISLGFTLIYRPESAVNFDTD